jgi:dTDP-4-amino-4,6-dideoxygalactose transaminase
MIDFFSLRARNDSFAGLIQEATREVLEESRFINGSHVEKFESEFADYLQVKHVVGLANGLDAITIALLALDIGDGDEVIVPGFTFIATWIAVSRVGATLVPVDVSLESANLGIDAVLENITARTKAVIAVNLYGRPALNPEEVVRIKALGIYVIEDAAQSHGVKSQGVRSGSYSDISCFSFYPTKNLGCLGDGGAIATNDFNLARVARKYANYGSGETKYTYSLQGLNSRLDSLQAAYLSIFLPHLDTWNLQRQNIASRYHSGISNLSLVRLNSDISVADSVWHHFVIRVENRQELIQQAQRSGIQLDVHYPTHLPRLKIFEKCRKVISGELKNSATLAEEVVSLPMYPDLSHDAQIEVLNFLNDFGQV